MRLTISTKLIVLAGACLLSLLVAGGLGLARVADIDRGLHDVVTREDAARDAALTETERDRIRGDLHAALATTDPAERDRAVDGIAQRVATLRQEVGELERALAIGTIVAGAAIVALALWIRHGILASVRPLRATVRALGAGDLRAGIPPGPDRAATPAGGDEIERIQHELDTAIGAVRVTLAEIDAEVLTLSTAAARFTAISRIDLIQAEISGPFTDQASATGEIERTAEGGSAAADITMRIDRIAADAGETTEAAVAAERGAADVARMAAHVKELLDGFRY